MVQTTDNIQHCCFAATGRTQNGYKITFPELQVDPLQGIDKIFSGLVYFMDIL
jgi:hypothetical protein